MKKLIWKYSSLSQLFLLNRLSWRTIICEIVSSHLSLHFIIPCVLYIDCIIINNCFSDIFKFVFQGQSHIEDILVSLFKVSVKKELHEKSLFLWPVFTTIWLLFLCCVIVILSGRHWNAESLVPGGFWYFYQANDSSWRHTEVINIERYSKKFPTCPSGECPPVVHQECEMVA